MSDHEFGAPPPLSAWGRMRPYFGAILTGGMFVGVSVYALQIVMPEGYKPTEVMGDAAGAFERHEIQAKMQGRLDYERGSTDSRTQAEQKGAVDQQIVVAAIQQQSDALMGMNAVAKLTDFLCFGGRVVAASTQPALTPGWRQQGQGGDWNSVAQNVARSTCGVGDILREGIQTSLIGAAQNAAAARGMSLTDGAIRQASTAQPVRTGPPVQEVAARPAVLHREWTQDQRAQLRAYADKQSRATLIQFVEGIDTVHNGLTPEWYDRVAAHRFEHPEQ